MRFALALLAAFGVLTGMASAQGLVPGDLRAGRSGDEAAAPGRQPTRRHRREGRPGRVFAERDPDARFEPGASSPALLPATLPATWSQNSETTGNCRLRFAPFVHGVQVTQDATFGDCGFGSGVTASGMYVLRAEKPLKT